MGLMRTREQMLDAMVGCSTKGDARFLVRQEVCSFIADSGGSLMEDHARRNVIRNIGYLTAFVPRMEAARLLDLFETEHPHYGPIEQWPPEREQDRAA